MASHFFGRGAAVEMAVVVEYTLLTTAHRCLVLQEYTSPMASLTCLTVIDIKDLLQT
jgi:hypothetical protein